MLPPKLILVPIDFSEASRAAPWGLHSKKARNVAVVGPVRDANGESQAAHSTAHAAWQPDLVLESWKK